MILEVTCVDRGNSLIYDDEFVVRVKYLDLVNIDKGFVRFSYKRFHFKDYIEFSNCIVFYICKFFPHCVNHKFSSDYVLDFGQLQIYFDKLNLCLGSKIFTIG